MEKVVSKKKLHDKKNDREYWLSKTPQERISAIEYYRKQFFGENYESFNRLQRVYKIIKKI